jgi:hypothetical protein
MRRRRSAKQRLWLGPDRHRGSCGRAITNSNAEPYGYRNGYAFGMRTDTVANTYGLTKSDRYCYCDGHTHCHRIGYGELDAETDAYTALGTVAEASSDRSAETIEILATGKISSLRSP